MRDVGFEQLKVHVLKKRKEKQKADGHYIAAEKGNPVATYY
jgi:hypothetical protein